MKRLEENNHKKKGNAMALIYIILGIACILLIILLIYNYIQSMKMHEQFQNYMIF